MSERDCRLANGTIFYPSDTMEECLRFTYCTTSQTIVTGLLSPADENGKCPDGVTPQSLFQWEEAKWIGGTMAYTNWTKREPVQANLISNTIDFPSLQLSVSYSSALSLKIFLQNQVSREKERECGCVGVCVCML